MTGRSVRSWSSSPGSGALVALAAGERTEGTRAGEQAVDALVGQDGALRPDVARILGLTGGGDQ